MLLKMKMQSNMNLWNTQFRMVHARGYNNFDDVPYHIFHEINAAMMACHNCPDYAFVFENPCYIETMTDF